MTEDARATTVLLVGALLVRLSVGGAFTRYVRTGMGPWLLVAGIILLVIGLAGVVRALRGGAPSEAVSPEGPEGPADSETSDDAHGHHHTDRVGWLLVAPILALLLVTPPALGSYGVDRTASVNVTSQGRTFDPLPPGRTASMTLLEFDERAADHGGASFGSTPVRLTGFVARTDDGRGFRIARYQIACCAADAVASVVRVTGASGEPPARDQWVTVTGTYHGSPGGVPELLATTLVRVHAPDDPYE